jgi:hypothetical protein
MKKITQLMNTAFRMFLCVVGCMSTNLSAQRDASIQYEDHNPGI